MAETSEPMDRETDTRKRWGSFLSRAVSTLGDVREAVVRTSQIGKIKIDTAFLLRERERLLKDLGELVFQMVEEGRLSLGEEHAPLLQALRDHQARIDEQDEELAAVEAEAEAAVAARQAAEAAAREAARAEEARAEASAGAAPAEPAPGATASTEATSGTAPTQPAPHEAASPAATEPERAGADAGGTKEADVEPGREADPTDPAEGTVEKSDDDAK